MMCKFLTYSLTLLTIVAGLFVVSACQKEEVSKNEVMLTFNTRSDVADAKSDATTDVESMQKLRVIMVNQDGTIIGNKNKPIATDQTQETFKFQAPVKNGNESFTFFAIANESSIVSDNLSWIEQSTGTLFANSINERKTTQIGNDAVFDFSKHIPQTKIWEVSYAEIKESGGNLSITKQLEYVTGKISVHFVNQTDEQQTISNIRILGITPNTKGYLFKQDGTDYIDSKDNNATSISWGKVLTLAAPTTGDEGETIYASDSVAYYTYPLAEGNFNSPMLYATWGDETEPRTLALSGITSLKRNEHLRIEITLTPAGDITVNYTIAPWEDTPTNIGDEAPTTPGNDYYVDAWGENSNIEIGGGGKEWNLGSSTITGEQVADWTGTADPNANSTLRIYIKNQDISVGNIILINFLCKYNNSDNKDDFHFKFMTEGDVPIVESNPAEDVTYEWPGVQSDEDTPYIRYLTLTEEVISKLKTPGHNQGEFDQSELPNYKLLIMVCETVKTPPITVGVKIKLLNMIAPD